MTITISGTSGVTYPAGGTDNVAGAGVGTTDSQTLTNKTLTSPTLNSPTIAGTPVINGSLIVSGTAQASTTGTSIDFTSIPSWVKRITVLFNTVSTSGTSPWLLQIGSGSITSSGYVSSSSDNGGVTTFTTGFGATKVGSGSLSFSGHCVITALGSNTYIQSGCLAASSTQSVSVSGGAVTLSGALDRLRITTVNGTDVFDAGSINILYE